MYVNDGTILFYYMEFNYSIDNNNNNILMKLLLLLLLLLIIILNIIELFGLLTWLFIKVFMLNN